MKNITKFRNKTNIPDKFADITGDPLFLDPWSEDFNGFPFQGLRSTTGERIKVVVLSAPLYKEDRPKFHKLKDEGYLVVGISSYGFYPFMNEDDFRHDSRSETMKDDEMKDIMSKVDCWLTCSRDPVPLNVPQLQFSESDCPNIESLKPKGLEKKYDVIYNAGSDLEFHEYHKNWPLAKKCIKLFSDNGLKTLVVGRNKPEDFDVPNVEYVPFLNWYEFIDKVEESKVLFVPNVSDASPRIITESLCKGVPVLVNKNIFGGWKYINENSGEFFTDENDVMESLNKIRNKKYDTRKWFIDTYFLGGESIQRKNLGKFIRKVVEDKYNKHKNN